MRCFLECGVARFGVVRFLCGSCGKDLFVPFSCKKRGACPSCDAKRSTVTTSRTLEELLPRVPYRQWVLTVPKRLRYFVHRDSALAGEICRALSGALTKFYRDVADTDSAPSAAPAQLLFLQRFGSSVNLHLHVHAVVSDGVFAVGDGKASGRLLFAPAREPSAGDIERLTEALRRRLLKRFAVLGAIPQEVAEEMLAWPNGGFSLDASVRVEAEDRTGLQRLLGYCTRPAISLRRLEYRAGEERVRYRPLKGREGSPRLLEWTPVEFLRRFSRLIPPPRKNLVRYAGALGPRSVLRPKVSAAARAQATYQELLAGWGSPAPLEAATAFARQGARRALSAALKAWAACLRRVFEVEPIICPVCGVDLQPVAAILDDREIERLLRHLGLPAELPRTRPARAPPPTPSEDCQLDPRVEAWQGIDEPAATVHWASA